MALTKEFEYDCEIRGEFKKVQVRKVSIIKEDGVEVTRNYERYILNPCTKTDDVWSDTDVSSEDASIQSVCNAIWTDAVKTAYKADFDANEPELSAE